MTERPVLETAATQGFLSHPFSQGGFIEKVRPCECNNPQVPSTHTAIKNSSFPLLFPMPALAFSQTHLAYSCEFLVSPSLASLVHCSAPLSLPNFMVFFSSQT